MQPLRSQRGLEDYPRALTRIAALWPSSNGMEVIEESVFRSLAPPTKTVRPGGLPRTGHALQPGREGSHGPGLVRTGDGRLTPGPMARTHFPELDAKRAVDAEPATAAEWARESGLRSQRAVDTYLDARRRAAVPSRFRRRGGAGADGLGQLLDRPGDAAAFAPGLGLDFDRGGSRGRCAGRRHSRNFPSSKSASQPENDPNGIDFELSDPYLAPNTAPVKAPKKPEPGAMESSRA